MLVLTDSCFSDNMKNLLKGCFFFFNSVKNVQIFQFISMRFSLSKTIVYIEEKASGEDVFKYQILVKECLLKPRVCIKCEQMSKILDVYF